MDSLTPGMYALKYCITALEYRLCVRCDEELSYRNKYADVGDDMVSA